MDGARTLGLADLAIGETAGDIVAEVDFLDFLADAASAVLFMENFHSSFHIGASR